MLKCDDYLTMMVVTHSFHHEIITVHDRKASKNGEPLLTRSERVAKFQNLKTA